MVFLSFSPPRTGSASRQLIDRCSDAPPRHVASLSLPLSLPIPKPPWSFGSAWPWPGLACRLYSPQFLSGVSSQSHGTARGVCAPSHLRLLLWRIYCLPLAGLLLTLITRKQQLRLGGDSRRKQKEKAKGEEKMECQPFFPILDLVARPPLARKMPRELVASQTQHFHITPSYCRLVCCLTPTHRSLPASL